MNSLTDPQGIKDAVNAIFAGGSTHPLADLARLIDCAISDAQFQGLGQFDVARWVAHAVNEDQKNRLAEFDKTAPHGNFVANPGMAPHPGNVNPAVGVVPPCYFDGATEPPTMSATTPEPQLSPEVLAMIERAPRGAKPRPNLDDVNTPGAHQVPKGSEYPPVEWDDSRPVTVSYRQGPGLWDFLKDLPTLPPVKTGDQPSMFEAFKAGKLTYGEVPELPPFPKLAFDLIPAMPEEIKASLDAAAEQLREGMEQAAKHVREKITAAQTEAARKLLAEQPHEHIYGRGSNGICRICGHESNSRRARAKRRAIHNEQAKAARQYPQHAPSEIVTYTKDGDQRGWTGTVITPADHKGKVQVQWHGHSGGTTEVDVSHISAPESQLYEALKAKGNGGDE